MKRLDSGMRSGLRSRIMMAFMLVIITWGVTVTAVVLGLFDSILGQQGLPPAVISTISARFLLACTGLSLIGVALFYFVARYLAQALCGPLQSLLAGVETLASGDLSARVAIHSEDELGELAAAFNQMAERLATLDRLKSEFVSTVSHELRTPMTSILGFSELLLDAELTEEQRREALAIVAHKAQELHDLIEGLLDLSRIEAGCELGLDVQPFELIALLEALLERYRGEERRHRFLFLPPSAPVWLAADRLRLERVVDNLLSNAVKYSPHGGEVSVRCTIDSGQMLLQVQDQGVGMSSQQQQHAFDKFYRVNGSDSAVRGVGLGLSIVRGIVLAHGGTIELASREGEGTTVTVCLPLPEQTTKPVAPEQEGAGPCQ